MLLLRSVADVRTQCALASPIAPCSGTLGLSHVFSSMNCTLSAAVSTSLSGCVLLSSVVPSPAHRVLPFQLSHMKIWDVRTGGICETLKYDHAVTALQFDTRKIVAATGENGIKVRFLANLALPRGRRMDR